MGLFDKLRNNLKNETPAAPTGWENIAAATDDLSERVNAQAELNKRRQHDKLIQIFKADTVDISKLAGEPAPAGEHDEDIVLAKIAYNKVTNENFAQILDNIKGPLTDKYGEPVEKAAASALGRMGEDKHQLKMLQHAMGGNPNNYMQTSIEDVEAVVRTFTNPMQFEAKMEPFMVFLAEHNSPQKVEEYEAALDELEHTLFGKKYDYYQRMKELVQQSSEIFGAPKENPLVIKEIPEVPQPVAEAKDDDWQVPESFLVRNTEREQSHERLIKAGSYYQISRAQAGSGERANMGEMLQHDPSCEDSSFVDPDNGFFGVFDGAGGHVGGARASSIGAETMADMMQRNGEPKTPDDLANWLDEASNRIKNEPSAGYSTATLAKVINRPDGKKGLMYASVGDSRLYIIHPNGRAELVTKDEGFENKITNALGYNTDRVCRQAGYRELNSGDKIMLCSDGITGDKGTDLMSEDEVGATVMAVDTSLAAQALVHRARKRDDRTAIVAEV